LEPKDEFCCEDICSIDYVHETLVRKTREAMLSPKKAEELATLFNAMGDPSRVKILYALSKQELCVCDLQRLLDMSQSAVSHQLRLLRDLRLVKYRRQGRMVFYSLDDEHIHRLFAEGLNHIEHE
jgi:DNA-binding transcriptional ArsR family regulator